jgi:uncharacterized protein YkwD
MRARWLVVIVAALAAGSVAEASVSSIEVPADVDRVAYRLAPPFRPQQTSAERAAFELVDLVNEERMRRDLPILLRHELVGAAAMAHADDMAARREMVHLGADGSDTGDRLARQGFAWRDWGEAIGAGFVTPQSVFDAWIASAADRAHVLGDQVYIGVGAAATPDGVPYWVLVVAT